MTPGGGGAERDPYAVLGVGRSASAGQITCAYRRLVRALHPDARPGRPAARERFAEVVEACTTLHGPARRPACAARRRPAGGRLRRVTGGRCGCPSRPCAWAPFRWIS